MAEVTDDFVAHLRAVRGTFENTRGGQIGNRVLAHVFSTFFPIVFISYLIFFSKIQWPLSSEGWLFVLFSMLTFGVGLYFHKTINSRFVFDDDGVQEYLSNGRLKQSIQWSELTKIEYRESRGIRNFTFKTSTESMVVEFYKSLSDAIAEMEKTKSQ